ncbi:MAG: sugar phosphate isomerase/epimerase family protein [Anaeroplasmataceae bacterium]
MKISYRAHDYGKSTPEELAKKIAAHGFTGVQLVLNKAIEGETGLAGTLNEEKCKRIRKAFNDNGLEITMMGAYFNPVHSNKELVNSLVLKYKEHLKYVKDFGSLYVGTETGSFNDDKWTYNPLNRTEEAYQEVKRIFSDLALEALKNDSYMAIEGAYGHCMYCPEQLKRLYNDINNGHVKIIVDIYNYLDISNYQEQREIFDKCIELFKDDIVIFHLKDFIVEDGKLKQVGLGQGIMDLEYFIPRMRKYCPKATLVFEGVKPVDIDSSLEIVHKYAGE